MMNNKDNPDQFLKELVQKTEVEKTSQNFTQNVMREVKILASMNNEKSSFSFSDLVNKWYLAGTAGVFAIAYLIYFIISNNIKIISKEYDPMIIPVFKKIFSTFRDLFHSFQISSFTIMIIGAILLLFLIDRLLKKFLADKHTFIL